MTWTVEATQLRPLLGMICGSQFWPRKLMLFPDQEHPKNHCEPEHVCDNVRPLIALATATSRAIPSSTASHQVFSVSGL